MQPASSPQTKSARRTVCSPRAVWPSLPCRACRFLLLFRRVLPPSRSRHREWRSPNHRRLAAPWPPRPIRLRRSRRAKSDASSIVRRGGGSSTDSNYPSGRTARSLWAWLFTRPSKSISGRNSKPRKTWKPPESSWSSGKPGWNRFPRPSSPPARVKDAPAG